MQSIQVNRPYKVCFLLTDVGFLLYWSVSLLMEFGIPLFNPKNMYYGYGDPIIFAWNWSFFPLDAVLAIMGLLGLYVVHDPLRRNILIISSAALTFCAGIMAISFWVLIQSFDPIWWAMNGFLCVWPAMFVVTLLRRGSESTGAVLNSQNEG